MDLVREYLNATNENELKEIYKKIISDEFVEEYEKAILYYSAITPHQKFLCSKRYKIEHAEILGDYDYIFQNIDFTKRLEVYIHSNQDFNIFKKFIDLYKSFSDCDLSDATSEFCQLDKIHYIISNIEIRNAVFPNFENALYNLISGACYDENNDLLNYLLGGLEKSNSTQIICHDFIRDNIVEGLNMFFNRGLMCNLNFKYLDIGYPLDYACENNYYNLIVWLLQHGSNPQLSSHPYVPFFISIIDKTFIPVSNKIRYVYKFYLKCSKEKNYHFINLDNLRKCCKHPIHLVVYQNN